MILVLSLLILLPSAWLSAEAVNPVMTDCKCDVVNNTDAKNIDLKITLTGKNKLVSLEILVLDKDGKTLSRAFTPQTLCSKDGADNSTKFPRPAGAKKIVVKVDGAECASFNL
jgi:hypothetical protein